MRSFISQRHTPSSPSLTMEKGAYRIHTHRRSPSKLQSGGNLQYRAGLLYVRENRMAVLVVLLFVAMAVSFGSAFYLFNTGWVSRHSARTQVSVSDLRQPLQVVEFERNIGSTTLDENAKYLSYLPHSGFHNQRIAFENALIMARLLNRTLLVPPVRLGKGTLSYYPFNHLYELLVLSGKDGLKHCSDATTWKTLPLECTDYYDYTLVPWNWLSNISSLAMDQPIMQRWNMSDAWLREHLGVSAADTFLIKDTDPYQFRFVDADPLDMPGPRYNDVISMSLLLQVPHRLIQVGTLFGSSRLRLRNKHNISLRREIRQSMVFTNDILDDLANTVKSKLGGEYVAAHIRLGDGHFEKKGERNVRLIWWRLVHEVLGVRKDVALDLEYHLTNLSTLAPPVLPVDLSSMRTPHPPFPPLPSTVLPRFACRHPWYEDRRLSALNTPLFISTDIIDPASHPLLRRFFDTFPCTFILADFVDEVASLGRLKSGYDGLMLRNFVLPFLDAMVAGRAHQLAGTEGSTFSQFVQDVLWRRYHGWEIVQRG
ncbi:hypothetical protein M0805_004086 [Coniferiporia weirii]|nr:hypothetical protein M0805_004086 [Coniferiporia weirii]